MPRDSRPESLLVVGRPHCERATSHQYDRAAVSNCWFDQRIGTINLEEGAAAPLFAGFYDLRQRYRAAFLAAEESLAPSPRRRTPDEAVIDRARRRLSRWARANEPIRDQVYFAAGSVITALPAIEDERLVMLMINYFMGDGAAGAGVWLFSRAEGADSFVVRAKYE